MTTDNNNQRLYDLLSQSNERLLMIEFELRERLYDKEHSIEQYNDLVLKEREEVEFNEYIQTLINHNKRGSNNAN